MMMIRSGDYTVDAHSLIGVFSLDINKPIELLLEKEPDDNFKKRNRALYTCFGTLII